MKRIIYTLVGLAIFSGCKDQFQETNTDPNVGIPQTEYLLTYVEKELVTYKGGGEWYHENHQKMAWAQYLTLGEGNSGDVNTILKGSKYETFYNTILPHLSEVRSQVALLTEDQQEAKKKMVAISDIIQAYSALRITDQYGDIPYSEAGAGRSEGLLNPVYDKQKDILYQLNDELNSAIASLQASSASEYDISSADIIYGGDASKWIMCANAVKMRIAVRLESQDLAKAKSIITEATSGNNLFSSNDDQFMLNLGGTYRGTAGAGFHWKGVMWAAKPMLDFMKRTTDPRIRIYYEMNGYTQESIDAFSSPDDISPAIDIENDNEVLFTTADGEDIYGYRYIGMPTHRQDENVLTPGYYFISDDPNAIGENTNMMSGYNRRLIQKCDYDYAGLPTATGNYVDVFISYAEVCFMMSEFILKGYAQGDAESWYNSGVEASIKSYDMMGEVGDLTMRVANKTYPYLSVEDSEIDNYMANSDILFDGVNDLEKVYIQQFLNLYRAPEEGWILCMRTGYPKYNSSLLPRYAIDNSPLPLPRRIPTPDPGDLNDANWMEANSSQGFTSPRDETPAVLNSQRIWWDANNGEVGMGN